MISNGEVLLTRLLTIAAGALSSFSAKLRPAQFGLQHATQALYFLAGSEPRRHIDCIPKLRDCQVGASADEKTSTKLPEHHRSAYARCIAQPGESGENSRRALMQRSVVGCPCFESDSILVVSSRGLLLCDVSENAIDFPNFRSAGNKRVRDGQSLLDQLSGLRKPARLILQQASEIG